MFRWVDMPRLKERKKKSEGEGKNNEKTAKEIEMTN